MGQNFAKNVYQTQNKNVENHWFRANLSYCQPAAVVRKDAGSFLFHCLIFFRVNKPKSFFSSKVTVKVAKFQAKWQIYKLWFLEIFFDSKSYRSNDKYTKIELVQVLYPFEIAAIQFLLYQLKWIILAYINS